MKLKEDASESAKSPTATESKVPGIQLVFLSTRNYFCELKRTSLKILEIFLGSIQIFNAF